MMNNKEIDNNDKTTIHLPRQCLRDGVKSLNFIGLLGWKRRIYTSFTPLEDRIGSQDVWNDKRYVLKIRN